MFSNCRVILCKFFLILCPTSKKLKKLKILDSLHGGKSTSSEMNFVYIIFKKFK